MGTILTRSTAVALLTLGFSAAAEAQCTTVRGEGNGATIEAASASTLQSWVRAARAVDPAAADWKYSIGLTVTCKVVTAGSGPRRHRRWRCEAEGRARKPGEVCAL